MTLKDLTRIFDNDTKIIIKILDKILYNGIIFNYSATLDSKYRDFEICNCKIEDGKLDILLEE